MRRRSASSNRTSICDGSLASYRAGAVLQVEREEGWVPDVVELRDRICRGPRISSSSQRVVAHGADRTVRSLSF
jgi:hypothetical protein